MMKNHPPRGVDARPIFLPPTFVWEFHGKHLREQWQRFPTARWLAASVTSAGIVHSRSDISSPNPTVHKGLPRYPPPPRKGFRCDAAHWDIDETWNVDYRLQHANQPAPRDLRNGIETRPRNTGRDRPLANGTQSYFGNAILRENRPNSEAS